MKKMKLFRSTVLLLTLTALFTVLGCTSVRPLREHGLKANLVEKDYEILGRVEYRGVAHNVLGFIRWGGAAYSKLYEKAQKELNADDVINVSIDYEKYAVGIFYNQRTYIMSGIAIKYKK